MNGVTEATYIAETLIPLIAFGHSAESHGSRPGSPAVQRASGLHLQRRKSTTCIR